MPERQRFASLCPHPSERERRLHAAAEARAAGCGGIAAVSAATGIAANTIGRGLKELAAPDTLDRVRRSGGRKLWPPSNPERTSTASAPFRRRA